jgi:hypothetical protein
MPFWKWILSGKVVNEIIRDNQRITERTNYIALLQARKMSW